ncbi:hypothetical protein PAPYR_4256 [Paratrimastix pyriformis]|uniref:Uncharacterized protein n=1 Tax=Paratrimastix pyriformis TaxID=342808 RepID=A0ABQ8UNF6_9EUKA|nr:hypothetical protein PAPYR_4256 [Paratrimastix pyriformis]
MRISLSVFFYLLGMLTCAFGSCDPAHFPPCNATEGPKCLVGDAQYFCCIPNGTTNYTIGDTCLTLIWPLNQKLCSTATFNFSIEGRGGAAAGSCSGECTMNFAVFSFEVQAYINTGFTSRFTLVARRGLSILLRLPGVEVPAPLCMTEDFVYNYWWVFLIVGLVGMGSLVAAGTGIICCCCGMCCCRPPKVVPYDGAVQARVLPLYDASMGAGSVPSSLKYDAGKAILLSPVPTISTSRPDPSSQFG